MKRHVQMPGVRKWTGNDLLELEGEPLKVADEFLGQYGNCVLCGCEPDGNILGAGLVSLGGVTMPVAETEVEAWPVWIVAREEHVTREYADGVTRDVAVRRYGSVEPSAPEAGVESLRVALAGCARFDELACGHGAMTRAEVLAILNAGN